MATKIGFIDYYLDEWHANNYPQFLREATNSRSLMLTQRSTSPTE